MSSYKVLRLSGGKQAGDVSRADDEKRRTEQALRRTWLDIELYAERHVAIWTESVHAGEL
jgi:hypothetical protein